MDKPTSIPQECVPEAVVFKAADALCGEWNLRYPDAVRIATVVLAAAPQPPAEAHCATCSCVPGMTPAVRFNTTPAEQDGAVRDHLIRMGWTPPAEAQQPATVDELPDCPHSALDGCDCYAAQHQEPTT